MNFTIERKTFLAEAQAAALAVERKPSIPILVNLLIEAGERHVTMIGTDLELGVVTMTEASVHFPGAYTVPAKTLIASLKASKAHTVTLALSEGKVSIEADGSKVNIPGISPESFPELPMPGKLPTVIPSATLAEAISHVSWSIIAEERRFTLNGFLLEIGEGKLTAVATDGHRLALFRREIPGTEPLRVLIPSRLMRTYARTSNGSPITGCVCDDSHLFLAFGKRLVLCPKLTGTFPDYERVVPKDKPTAVLTCDAAELLALVKRAVPYSDERSRAVEVTVSDANLTIAAFNDKGEFSGSITPEKVKGPNVRLGVNYGYLADYLALVKGKTVIEFRGTKPEGGEFKYDRVIVLKPVDDPGFTQYIMPMRI